jgi:menaquinone-dependent protoporphyrinogen IX oxidase
VSAASRHHGTWEIAQAIATGLVDRGVAAEARPIEAVTDLADYGTALSSWGARPTGPAAVARSAAART